MKKTFIVMGISAFVLSLPFRYNTSMFVIYELMGTIILTGAAIMHHIDEKEPKP